MRFRPLSSMTYSPEVLSADFTSAHIFERVRLGEQAVYFSRLSGTAYLPYSAIRRAWLRQEMRPVCVGCRRAPAPQFLLVMEPVDGEPHKIEIPSLESGNEILALIRSHNPEAEIGYKQDESLT